MNEPLYKTFLTARLSLRSNNKIARQYFFDFSFSYLKLFVVVQKKTSLKITWNSKTQGFDLNVVQCLG